MTEKMYTEPLFDKEGLLRKLGGREETVLRIMRQFAAGNEYAGREVGVHMRRGEFMEARSILHDIIGISGNLCMNRLYEAACTLRLSCHAQSTEGLETFESIWENTIREVGQYLTLHPQQENTSGSRPFGPIWSRFIDLCREYDMQAAELFEEKRGEFRRALGEAYFKRTEDALNRFDLGWIAENMTYTGE